jgi:hypothetical protein
MQIIDENDRDYKEAKKKVEEEKKFYYHLGVYAVMNVFFVILNLVTSPDHLWFYWPMLGWGLGIFLQGVRVFTGIGLSKNWEERRIEKHMRNKRRE